MYSFQNPLNLTICSDIFTKQNKIMLNFSGDSRDVLSAGKLVFGTLLVVLQPTTTRTKAAILAEGARQTITLGKT